MGPFKTYGQPVKNMESPNILAASAYAEICDHCQNNKSKVNVMLRIHPCN